MKRPGICWINCTLSNIDVRYHSSSLAEDLSKQSWRVSEGIARGLIGSTLAQISAKYCLVQSGRKRYFESAFEIGIWNKLKLQSKKQTLKVNRLLHFANGHWLLRVFKCAILGLFLIYFRSFQAAVQMYLQHSNVKMIHLVYGVEIWTHKLCSISLRI